MQLKILAECRGNGELLLYRFYHRIHLLPSSPRPTPARLNLPDYYLRTYHIVL